MMFIDSLDECCCGDQNTLSSGVVVAEGKDEVGVDVGE
jgi:hypothetical protein